MNTKESLAEVGIDCSTPPETLKDGYPSYWPVLEPGEVNRGHWVNDGAPVCLLGWCNWLTSSPSLDNDYEIIAQNGVRETIYHAMRKAIGMEPWEQRMKSGPISVMAMNDIGTTTDTQRAAWWNKTGRSLGYDIPLNKCSVSKKNPAKLGSR